MVSALMKLYSRNKLKSLDLKINALERAALALMRTTTATEGEINQARDLIRRTEAQRDVLVFKMKQKGLL